MTNRRQDKKTATYVGLGIALARDCGIRVAARWMASNNVPYEVARRVLIEGVKR